MFIQKKNPSLFSIIIKRLQNIFLFNMFFPLNILPIVLEDNFKALIRKQNHTKKNPNNYT